MRTPMVCFDTTFPKGRTCRYTHRNIWTRLLGNSTSGHARRWTSQLRQKHLMHVLHRPVEPADIIIHIIWTLIHLRTCQLPAAPPPHCRWSRSAPDSSRRCLRPIPMPPTSKLKSLPQLPRHRQQRIPPQRRQTRSRPARWPTQDGFHPTFKLRKPLILALCGMVFDEVFVCDDDYRWDY